MNIRTKIKHIEFIDQTEYDGVGVISYEDLNLYLLHEMPGETEITIRIKQGIINHERLLP